jgi:hypothetical protein
MMRLIHNAQNPDSPIYHRDIAAYIGLKTKTTLMNYESEFSVPRLTILSKWLEFWGYKLAIVPIEEGEDEEPAA